MAEYSDDFDVMTGYGNKASYEKYIYTIEHEEKFDGMHFGVICTDINDLKHYMDYNSLSMGDVQIKKTAVLIQEATECRGEYFRVGGDEFVVIFMTSEQENFDIYVSKIAELKQNMENSASVSFASGSCYVTSGKDICKALRSAFEEMCTDKERYHAGHPK